MKKHFFLKNKSFLLGMVVSLSAMLCVCLPANAINEGILRFENYKELPDASCPFLYDVQYLCCKDDSHHHELYFRDPDNSFEYFGRLFSKKDNIYKKDGYIFIDLQSIKKGKWYVLFNYGVYGTWYYANEEDVIWKAPKIHLESIASTGAPLISDPSTWVKKNGYTIMHNVPVVNQEKPEDSYCVVYFDGKGVYDGYYRTGYTAQKGTWYIFDIEYGKGNACLTAGELYNVTPEEYLAANANANLNSLAKKTIWLGEEYPYKNNTVTDAQVLKCFESRYGLKSNKTGTKKMSYSYKDKVFFPAINIGQGIHHYDFWGNPVYATIYQGDFDYYGECTASTSISGWKIKGDSIIFHYSKPAIQSTKYYIDPSRYNPMNFDEGAMKAYKYQDNVALSTSNVDDKFKKKFQSDVNNWLKEIQSLEEENSRFKIIETRQNSILCENDGQVYNILADKNNWPDPASSYENYSLYLNKKIVEKMSNKNMTQNLKNILNSAANVCVLSTEKGIVEMLIMDWNGDLYDCDFAITKDAKGNIGWNAVRVKKDDYSVPALLQFNKKCDKSICPTNWKNRSIITKPYKNLQEIVNALLALPEANKELEAVSLYTEELTKFIKDNYSSSPAKKTLLSKFKDEKKKSAMMPPTNRNVSSLEDFDFYAEEVEKYMEDVYIFHDYITKGKSADAKALSKPLGKAKTREEIITALDIKVPNMKGKVKERINAMIDTTSIPNIEWIEKYVNREQDESINNIVEALNLYRFPEYNIQTK